jgi:hypothetical protein
MTGLKRSLLVVLGIAALAIPAGAVAKQGENHGTGKAKGHRPHDVAYVFKGSYAGDGSVEVKAGNSRVRKGGYVGQTVAFDLSAARILVGDTNGDGQRNLDDVETGDWVLVKARLPRTDPGDQPFDAKRLTDQTHNPGKQKGPKNHS